MSKAVVNGQIVQKMTERERIVGHQVQCMTNLRPIRLYLLPMYADAM